jgi:flagellar protein FliO/FliZ
MEFDEYLRFALTLVFVLALIGLLSFAVRRFAMGRTMPLARGKDRRLQVVEVAVLDSKRRLVLVRRDNTEHLIMLGPGNDVVVETGFPASAPEIGPAEDGTP